MTIKTELAQDALHKALQIRQKARIALTDALCVYDVVEANGISEVRFVDIPSLEELYWQDDDRIFVSALRPSGRKAFNCAHGFGHHVFGHGNCITSVSSNGFKLGAFDANEFTADSFASFLLMPRTTVSHGFAVRGWQPGRCTPLQVYAVACWLGVGYTTLVHHMRDTLKLISRSLAESCLKVKPKEIRAELLGRETSEDVFVVDSHWTGRPIDIEVGDLVVLPVNVSVTGEGVALVDETASAKFIRGVAPGDTGRVFSLESQWSAFLRVSRRGYCGRNLFRHLEDPDHVNN